MRHINSLLSLLFHEHFKKLIELGYIYIALTPLYRITLNKDNYKYFKDDKEYNNFKSKYISDKYKLIDKKLKMKDIVDNMDHFLKLFDIIKYKHTLDDEVMNVFIHSEDINQILEELTSFGLAFNEEELHFEGLFNDCWHDFSLEDDFLNDMNTIREIYNRNTLKIKDNSTGEELEGDVHDVLKLLNSTFKFSRYRFKGVGEISAEELFNTTLDPERRNLVQLKLSEEKGKDDDTSKLFFGNNADLRKEFIDKNL